MIEYAEYPTNANKNIPNVKLCADITNCSLLEENYEISNNLKNKNNICNDSNTDDDINTIKSEFKHLFEFDNLKKNDTKKNIIDNKNKIKNKFEKTKKTNIEKNEGAQENLDKIYNKIIYHREKKSIQNPKSINSSNIYDLNNYAEKINIKNLNESMDILTNFVKTNLFYESIKQRANS